jgi:hypothetical protein
MVSHDEIQEEWITKLKGNATVSAAVNGDIREEGYKGNPNGGGITYPNIRVQVSMQSSKGDSCRETHSVVSGVVTVYVEDPSSKEASHIIGLVADVLVGSQIWAAGWHIATLKSNGMRAPLRHEPDLWKGELFIYGNVYETA